MTKKNIRPQQVAPVQREATATSTTDKSGQVAACRLLSDYDPFAGDDAE